MADYAKFISLAQRLIAVKGASMLYLQISEKGALDPVTGKRQVEIEKHDVTGVCVKPTKDEMQAGYFKGADMVILVEGQSVNNASTADIIRFAGHEYNITEIIKVAPAGDCILYKFGVKDNGLWKT